MCGLVGFLSQKSNIDLNEKSIRSMTDAMISRGPDDSGIWSDSSNNIWLGHRRLSILDVSSAGHQPMLSKNEDFVLVFNGEIYNHLELRAEIEKKQGCNWRGNSDTESLLTGFEKLGIDKTLAIISGMFSFALWDKKSKIITLGRDRIGEKPMYYGWQNETFYFGSELKALTKHHAFNKEIDRNSLCLLMRHNYIPAPFSVYKGIKKLKPGTILKVSLKDKEPKEDTYWSSEKIALKGIQYPFRGTRSEAVDTLENLLKESVKKQMIADVPLGAFLSGGVDSSTIVALMQAQSTRPIKTFTIGFSENQYNEANFANSVAKHLGTCHTELYVSPKQAMDVIPHLPTIYDEPFADSSQIPTYLVSKLAKQHVTVALSGDAGDELFCGYNRYQMASKMWNRINCLPQFSRRLLANMMLKFSPQFWTDFASFIPKVRSINNFGDKVHKGAPILLNASMQELYAALVSHWQNPESLIINGTEPKTILNESEHRFQDFNQIQKMMILDLLTYLPDDILVKVDKAAMGVSLESRIPFLDPMIIEFAWSLPDDFKIYKNQTKWILRQVLHRHVPEKLIDRPKMGFGIPIDVWLRGPMKDWAYELIKPSRLKMEGYFNPDPIHQKWNEHLSGKRNWAYHLWDILMFQSWLESQ